MSQSGHAVVVDGTTELERGEWFGEHRHDRMQLACATRGVLSVRIGGRTWVLPSGLGLWIPRRVWHDTGAATAADMLRVYIDPRRCPIRWAEPTVVRIDALVRELLAHLSSCPPRARSRRHAEALLWTQLHPVEQVVIDVPEPTDPRAADVAAGVLADPSDTRSLAAWGRSVGASERTLARMWQDGTGIGFAEWRVRVRIRAAVPLLADGLAVNAVAPRVGYRTASAFVAAFRRTVGVSPGAYFTDAG